MKKHYDVFFLREGAIFGYIHIRIFQYMVFINSLLGGYSSQIYGVYYLEY